MRKLHKWDDWRIGIFEKRNDRTQDIIRKKGKIMFKMKTTIEETRARTNTTMF